MRTPDNYIERTPGRRVWKSRRWFTERRSGFDRRARLVGLCYTYVRPL